MKQPHKNCFTCLCCAFDCPNIAIDLFDHLYGYGVAEDAGYKRTACKKCSFNTYECKDCLWEGESICPEYVKAESEVNNADSD